MRNDADLIKVIESDEMTVIIHSKSRGCSDDYILIYTNSLFIEYKPDEIPEMLNGRYFNIDSNTIAGTVEAFNLQKNKNGEFFLPTPNNINDRWASMINTGKGNIKYIRW